ncbi:hypothetical protein L211DRAFT_833178 [Terfezia boudieri ATCC MYA-4762]|uniref:Uncharacterized protein n=1 Tax=Terfezia boudieri ATCC MYA-4762 TaxID=1051890 RepID=A0A3N4M605_9PEZI|nr:hypothetical protein L211DRAFT_833178 [Terfezia boudieri ATCC MYA-4762]
MPCLTDLEDGHKQDVKVLRKYFQQGMLTYRAKRMMKRAVEELKGRWEVKSIGLWLNTERDSMAKVCGTEAKEILERADAWAVSNPDPDWANSNSLCPWPSFVALANAQARSQSIPGQNAATKEDICLLRTWFKRGMLTGYCRKMVNHVRAHGHLNAKFWTNPRITNWIKLEKALITMYSGEEAAVLGIALKWGINGHRNPNVEPESEWFSWDLEMMNYRTKGIRVKSDEPEGFTFGVPISLTTPVKIKMEHTIGNQNNPTNTGMQISTSMLTTSVSQQGCLRSGPVLAYVDLGFAKDPQMVNARENATRQEQLRQQPHEKEAHLAYLSQQERLKQGKGPRQAWIHEQERMRHEEEQKCTWSREQKRIRYEENEGRQARIREQESSRCEEARQIRIREHERIEEKARQARSREPERLRWEEGQARIREEEGLRYEEEARQVDIRKQAKIQREEEPQARILEGQKRAQLNDQVVLKEKERPDALHRSICKHIRREGRREKEETLHAYFREEERLRHEHEEAKLLERANILEHQARPTVEARTGGYQGEVVLGYESAVNGSRLEEKLEFRGEVAQWKVSKSQGRNEEERRLPVEKDGETVRLLEEEATAAHKFTTNISDFRKGDAVTGTGIHSTPQTIFEIQGREIRARARDTVAKNNTDTNAVSSIESKQTLRNANCNCATVKVNTACNPLRLEEIGSTGTTMCSAFAQEGSHGESLDAQRVHIMDTDSEEANASELHAPGTPDPTVEQSIAALQVIKVGGYDTTAGGNAGTEVNTADIEKSHRRQADDPHDDLVVFQSRPRRNAQDPNVARDNIKKRPREAKNKQKGALQQFLNGARGLGLPGLSPSGNVTVNIFNVKRMKVKHLHAGAPATPGNSG